MSELDFLPDDTPLPKRSEVRSELTAKLIIHRLLYWWLESYVSFVLPNYTPRGWWECDVFEVTKAGYFREYEVKLTRSDFRADMDKRKDVYPRLFGSGPIQQEMKHDLLAKGDRRGPKNFYYVTPTGLIAEHELPAYAGLIEIDEKLRFTEVKKAPKLHSYHFSLKAMTAARRSCYGRMHDLLIKSGRKNLTIAQEQARI